MAENDTIYVGIDFGAVRSVVGVWVEERDTVEIIQCEADNKYLPTCVHYPPRGKPEVGSAAQKDYGSPDTIYFVKQLIGREFDDASQVNGIPSGHCGPLVKNRKPYFKLSSGKTVDPEDVYVEILTKLKNIIEKKFPSKDTIKLVITVPATADDKYRRIILDKAGKNGAGFDDVQLIAEPNAAALAHHANMETGQFIAVVDIGEATTEVSISMCRDTQIQVLVKNSDNIGGVNFDHAVVDYVLHQLGASNPSDALRSQVRLAWLKAKVEWEDEKTNIEIEGYKTIPLDRAKFKDLNAENFARVKRFIRNIAESQVMEEKAVVDAVALLGGSSQIPEIISMVENAFGREILHNSEGFAIGESVAFGATIQAKNLFASDEDTPVLLDVASRNIGMQTFGGIMTPFITHDTPIPTTDIIKRVTTSRDKQTSLNIKIYEGEDRQARRNKLLGTFNLTRIPEKPKGRANILVSMNMDSDGILVVKAVEKSQGHERTIRIERT